MDDIIKEIETQNVPVKRKRGRQFGCKVLESTKKKISRARKGKKYSKKPKKLTRAHRKKISQTMMGHEIPDEVRLKISKAKKGVPLSKENLENILKAKEKRKREKLKRREIARIKQIKYRAKIKAQLARRQSNFQTQNVKFVRDLNPSN